MQWDISDGFLRMDAIKTIGWKGNGLHEENGFEKGCWEV